MTHWILYGRKWHAWPSGATKSFCGCVTASHLGVECRRIVQALPPEHRAHACKTCSSKANLPPIPEPNTPPTVQAWAFHIQAHCAGHHIHVAKEDRLRLATLLSEIGSPQDPNARETYEQIRHLFLTPFTTTHRDRTGRVRHSRKVPGLHDALQRLPPRSGTLMRLAAVMRCWRHITGGEALGKVKPDQIVQVMLQMPDDPTPYIQRLASQGFSHLSAIFHPNTYRNTQKRDTSMRGYFNPINQNYWDSTSNQLNVVE